LEHFEPHDAVQVLKEVQPLDGTCPALLKGGRIYAPLAPPPGHWNTLADTMMFGPGVVATTGAVFTDPAATWAVPLARLSSRRKAIPPHPKTPDPKLLPPLFTKMFDDTTHVMTDPIETGHVK
jgi:hypothetical protein